MFLFLAIFWGLLLNYLSWWVPFHSVLCFFAGIFLIMPALLRLRFRNFSLLFKKKKLILFISLFFNFLFVPLVFFLFWYFFFDLSFIKYAFLLLGFLSGGGLLMNWIIKTWGNKELGFQLFMLHLLLFSFFVFPFLNSFLEGIWEKQVSSFLWWINNTEICVFEKVSWGWMSCFGTWGEVSPFIAFFVLILFPFILSRIVRFFPKVFIFLEKYIKKISSFASFLIIFYIFSLKEVNEIFKVDISFIIKLLIVLLFAYFLIFLFAFFVYFFLKDKQDALAFFWLGVSRFITLGLIFSFIYSWIFWIEFLLVFVCSYFIQILFSLLQISIFKKIQKNNK